MANENSSKPAKGKVTRHKETWSPVADSPGWRNKIDGRIHHIPTPFSKAIDYSKPSSSRIEDSMCPSTTNTSYADDRTTPPLKRIGDFVLHRSLGRGSMGKVKLGVNYKTGEKIAVKIVTRANAQSFTRYSSKELKRLENREMRTIREAHIMMLLEHPHIVNLRDLVVTNNHLYILMDYVKGGQLQHYIVKRQRLTEHRARHFARQIASALDYMHRNSIVHRDLKIENILLDEDGTSIKIIDFGLSNLFCPERLLETYCGSLYFAAPELLCAKPYHGPEIDVWSLGVVIYVMVTGVVPFDDKSIPGLHEKIKRGHVAFPSCLTPECRDLLSRIFVTDPMRRILLADVLRHPWVVRGYNGPPCNYLPLREPLHLPLDDQIVNLMTQGFGFGTAVDIHARLNVILQSEIYRTAALRVCHSQRSDKVRPVSPPLSYLLSPYDARYNDPQCIPAAYHPLLSIYYLTRERLLQLKQNQKKHIQPAPEAVPKFQPSNCSHPSNALGIIEDFENSKSFELFQDSLDYMTRIKGQLSETTCDFTSFTAKPSARHTAAKAFIPLTSSTNNNNDNSNCSSNIPIDRHKHKRFRSLFPRLSLIFSRRRSAYNNDSNPIQSTMKSNHYQNWRHRPLPPLPVRD